MSPYVRAYEPGLEEPKKKDRRGFASMDHEKRHEICSQGGKAAHKKKNPKTGFSVAHEFRKGEEATRDAGRKGGEASWQSRKAAKEAAQKAAQSGANASASAAPADATQSEQS
jgi:general stress protein YciG